MAKQVINVGTAPNSKDGDLLRSAFIKINENFTEVYGSLTSEQASRSSLINGEHEVVLNSNGTVSIPAGGDILDSNGNSVLVDGSQYLRNTYEIVPSETPTIIWSSRGEPISTVKLIINIEALEIGSDGERHTQSCEAIIANRVYKPNAEPAMTVYGVTHTSIGVLATFTIQRNITTQQIEVVATSNALVVNGSAYSHVYSTELLTAD